MIQRPIRQSWSPDSERIAFTSTRSGSREIWVIRRDGTDLEQLTNSAEEMLSSPVWSPDGTRIAGLNITQHNAFLFDPSKPWGDPPPELLPPLNEQGDHLVVRSWSRDGRFLLGGWPPDHSGKKGVGVYDLVAERFETILDFPTSEQRWLSDGRRFIFRSSGPGAIEHMVRAPAPTALFIGDRIAKTYRELLDVGPDSIASGLEISKDDRMIYFAREHREADIWLLELEPGSP